MAESQKSPRLFERIAQRTDRLEVRGSRVHIREYIETPYDEYGIIDKRALFARIMGSVAGFDWEGSYEGPHILCGRAIFIVAKGTARSMRFLRNFAAVRASRSFCIEICMTTLTRSPNLLSYLLSM